MRPVYTHSNNNTAEGFGENYITKAVVINGLKKKNIVVECSNR